MFLQSSWQKGFLECELEVPCLGADAAKTGFKNSPAPRLRLLAESSESEGQEAAGRRGGGPGRRTASEDRLVNSVAVEMGMRIISTFLTKCVPQAQLCSCQGYFTG